MLFQISVIANPDLNVLEVFTGKALKGEVVVVYFEPLITQPVGTSVRPQGEN